jgi:hypothetical protein
MGVFVEHCIAYPKHFERVVYLLTNLTDMARFWRAAPDVVCRVYRYVRES